ncbi:MAG: phage portal protein [Caulobacterales bacterium]|uniref:phage portal protein n=1 Tax=Glycocaulis sp. TaxID=1969725 RepID=UPI003FA0D77B
MAVATASRPRHRVKAGSRRLEASAGTLTENVRSRTAFQAGDPLDQAMSGWSGSRGSADRDWLSSRLTAVARSRDAARNDPLAAGLARRKRAHVAGWGWLCQPRPDMAALGIDTSTKAGKASRDRLIRSMKRQWKYFADDPIFRCDVERSLDADLLLMLATTHKVVDGEAVVLICWKERTDGFRYSTCFQIIDPDRLANPMGRPDSDRLRAGVELDEDGAPVAYHFLRSHPADIGFGLGSLQTDRVPAREDWGRPRVLHLFEKRRAGQHRGIGDLVASLRRFRTLEAYTDAELRSKVVNALVLAQYTSSMGGEILAEIFGGGEAEKLMALRSSFYEESGLSVAGSRVINTFPGDKLDLNRQARESGDYADFAHAIAAQCAGPAGSTYEMITGDFTRHNYSSGRMSLGEAWREVLLEREITAKQLMTPLRLCVLEEAFYAGHLDLPDSVPDFWEELGAYSACEWIGPPRGAIDPVKEPTGHALRLGNLSASPQEIAAEDGRDFDEVLEETADAKERLQAMGLSMADLGHMIGAASQAQALSGDEDIAS